MTDTRNYALVASLPRLVHFEQAEFVPITRQKLESRLRTLNPDQWNQLLAAWDLMRWQDQPFERTTADIVAQYEKAMKIITDPALREFVEFWMGERTAVVALRMRRRGETPQPEIPWGVGRWTRKIAAHWDDNDLGLGAIFPWIEQARPLVEAQDALELERLLINVVWKKLTEIEGRTPLGFERVIAFVFKWEFVKRWLSFNAEAAKERFQELIEEVTREHQQIFS